MNRTLAIVILGLVGLTTTVRTSAQLERRPWEAKQTKQEDQANPPHRAQAQGPTHHRGDTWYEFLFRQFNPSNFDYGAWMEERRWCHACPDTDEHVLRKTVDRSTPHLVDHG